MPVLSKICLSGEPVPETLFATDLPSRCKEGNPL